MISIGRLALCLATLVFFGLLHWFWPHGQTSRGTKETSLRERQFTYHVLRSGVSVQDGTTKSIQVRYPSEKAKGQPSPNQRFIREKIKGFADRGPKASVLFFSGDLVEYIPVLQPVTRHLLHFIHSYLPVGSARIRPPPEC